MAGPVADRRKRHNSVACCASCQLPVRINNNNRVAHTALVVRFFEPSTQQGGVIMSIHATKELQAYWKENLFYIAVLLSIWFVVSYVCGILIVNQLDAYTIGGFPLGFWFANQGSLVTFVVLIWVYVWLMDRLDIKYNVQQ
jgi:putative solute:sodium symporter small subunit